VTSDALRGMGVALVREREIAERVQAMIEGAYELDRVADVRGFLRGARSGRRETLLVREAADGAVEMMLELPELGPANDLDGVCQIIEGVSHFVYVSTRAAQDRGSTALEMEMQAEVDKYVVLAGAIEDLDVERSERLRERLYEQVRFVHDAHSDLGERYRVANRAASRFVQRMEARYVRERRFGALRRELHAFFRSGLEEKLRRAA
jgi:hypothetical protein